MDEGDAIVTNSPAHGGGGGSGHEPQENIDYDVADDNDWGVN
jgi:RNA-binding protein 26